MRGSCSRTPSGSPTGAQELIDRGATCVLISLSSGGAEQLDPLDQLRKLAPDVAVVALTDTADDKLAIGAIRAGAQDCLLKADLNPARLRRAVRHSIASAPRRGLPIRRSTTS
jgi:DNA-binding NarL/FixJ family response regulator